MQNHFIIEMLGIKDPQVDVWEIRDEGNRFVVELFTKQRVQRCPFCEGKTKRVHSYRSQEIQGPVVSNKKVDMILKKRRYVCMGCERTFYERLQMVGWYQRCTTNVQATALVQVALGSFTTAAQLSGLTTNRVLRWFERKTVETKTVLPRSIAIDEFKGDAGGERFQMNVVDVENREIIDILPNRKVETIRAYLQSCDTSAVEIVVMDLSKSFKHAVKKELGNPLIIADRFHFMRQVYWALDDVRKDVQKGLEKKERIRMKRSKKLLWKSRYTCSDEQKEKVKRLIEGDSRLKEAYELKNELDKWFKESDEKTVTKGFEACIEKMKGSTIEAFHRVAQTFLRWRQEILQSFMYPYNNGYIEGVNNTIKVLKRTSYGIKKFERLKKKILWQQEVKLVLKQAKK